jgi:beta-1,4-mannosyltransferase
MLYHARALADSGARVTLIGRAGSSMPVRFLDDDRIRVKLLPARRPRATIGAETGRWLLETGRLLVEIVRGAPDVILLQAPPLFPAALAALAASSLCGARFVVDWHNFGDGLLALRPNGSGAPAATLAALERMLGRRADAHLTVSKSSPLPSERRDIRRSRFRDRPHERFSMPSATEVAAFARSWFRCSGSFRRASFSLCRRRAGAATRSRPSADGGAARIVPSRSARPVLLLASGEGEGRPAFEARSATLLRRVAIRTTFVPGDVYPLLVRSADAGISLHKPALGLDPPMKVADLLGSGVPVLELRAGPAPASLVVAGRNGLAEVRRMRRGARQARSIPPFRALSAGAGASEDLSFRQAWAAEVAPVLLGGVA